MITRRKFVTLGAAAPVAASLGCGDNAAGDAPDAAPDAASFDCVLTPEQTAGPFYFDPQLERADIREDRDGTRVTLALEIVAASDCMPQSGLRVDAWHCDAAGLYSGYPNQGENGDVDTTGMTFLRGTQTSDSEGRVEFVTVYPGWYPGRAVHIHIRVFTGDTLAATAQIYFPDSITDTVFATAPYSVRGPRDRTNETDSIANDPEASGILLALSEDGAGYRAELTIGVA